MADKRFMCKLLPDGSFMIWKDGTKTVLPPKIYRSEKLRFDIVSMISDKGLTLEVMEDLNRDYGLTFEKEELE